MTTTLEKAKSRIEDIGPGVPTPSLAVTQDGDGSPEEQKVMRMDEMEQWANAIGSQTEAAATVHKILVTDPPKEAYYERPKDNAHKLRDTRTLSNYLTADPTKKKANRLRGVLSDSLYAAKPSYLDKGNGGTARKEMRKRNQFDEEADYMIERMAGKVTPRGNFATDKGILRSPKNIQK